MLNANITITGLDKAKSQLSKVDEKVKDLRPILQEAGEWYMEYFSTEPYATEGGTYGAGWAPLSPKYAEQKLRKWGAVPILIASGRMSRSYSLKTASDSFTISNDAVNRQGNYYARYHQDGTDRMPQRMVMKFQDEQLSHVADIIVSKLNDALKSAM